LKLTKPVENQNFSGRALRLRSRERAPRPTPAFPLRNLLPALSSSVEKREKVRLRCTELAAQRQPEYQVPRLGAQLAASTATRATIQRPP